MEKLRVGVVGVGYLGKFHAQKYAAMPDVDLVGVADTDPAQAREVAALCDTAAFDSYKDLLGKVRAVSVAVPTPFHFPVGRDFLENNVDVLMEKPIASTREEARALVGLAKSRGLILQVGHLERFNPAVKALVEAVREPLFIEAQRLSTFKPRALNVGVVLDLMIHDIDIALWLARSPIQSIQASGAAVVTPFPDLANARIVFESGCVASLTAGRLSGADQREVRVFEKNQCASVDFVNRTVAVTRPGPCPDSSGAPGVEARCSTFEKADALAAETAAFVRCVRLREQPLVTGQVGAQALDAALTITEQIEKHHA